MIPGYYCIGRAKRKMNTHGKNTKIGSKTYLASNIDRALA
jgi:hypothetical protein